MARYLIISANTEDETADRMTHADLRPDEVPSFMEQAWSSDVPPPLVIPARDILRLLKEKPLTYRQLLDRQT
jgi:hypothetical protein